MYGLSLNTSSHAPSHLRKKQWGHPSLCLWVFLLLVIVLFPGVVSQPHRMNEQRKVVGLHPSVWVDEVLFQRPSMKSLFSCGLFIIVFQLYSSYKEVPAIDAFH